MASMAMVVAASVAVLLVPGSSVRNVHVTQTFRAGLESIPMVTYKADCWKKKPVTLAQVDIPGAGINAFEPFETVEKDGFYLVECIKDYMFTHGDKFGDNNHEYKLGELSNVSIVHYAAHVPREDRVAITHKVCFEFCRTVPDMLFFGILNGRECYCAPYFKQMESDSSMCDAVCDGDNSLMCGGKTKSSIFEMHMCASTRADLGTAVDKGTEVADAAKDLAANAKFISEKMQTVAAALQTSFGTVGDPAAADLMQIAKVTAGDVEQAAKAAVSAESILRGLATDAKALANFEDPAEVTRAERLMENLEESAAKGEIAVDELAKLVNLTSSAGEAVNTSAEYFPIMYFVDTEFEKVPATCSGGKVARPIGGGDLDACAASCDSEVHDCVGFQYFGGDNRLCFLFSSFRTATYYTGCKKAAPFPATCMARVSKFVGTMLKPDGSGKCKACLKEANKADRCYAAAAPAAGR